MTEYQLNGSGRNIGQRQAAAETEPDAAAMPEPRLRQAADLPQQPESQEADFPHEPQETRPPADAPDLLVLRDICRQFARGDVLIPVLKNISLTIKRGEMVAIIGQSGSGKSTLMNILGCLDRPSSGRYLIDGREAGALGADALSALRRNHFGFIFQRYHLLGELTALGNVEIPAIYAGMPPQMRKKRAEHLLARLGMGDRVHHYPSQLSGGQQQRVSIARALMNDGEIILADEPTGALDKHSGEEVLTILEEIHASGRTVIVVTHDMAVAKRAKRIIEISDGEIIADRANIPPAPAAAPAPAEAESRAERQAQAEQKQPAQSADSSRKPPKRRKIMGAASLFWDRLFEAQHMALLSMAAHRMRTFLTMLGVIIGIAAVIAVVALGKGTQIEILANINRLGTNTLTLYAGKSMADVRAAKVTTLVEADADALRDLPYIEAVTPMIAASTTARSGNVYANALLSGVSEQFFAAQGARLMQGRLFDKNDVTARNLGLVIEKDAVPSLFPDMPASASPIGKIVLVGRIATPIIGVIDLQRPGASSDVLALYLPYTTVQTRFLGSNILRSITALLSPKVDSRLAQALVTRFMKQRHGAQDFFIRNSQDFIDEVISTTNILRTLVASIAFISLFVGGIGVMNIMLVAVSERINEIGVRMAVGARRSDILQQFLTEAVLVCLTGGLLGIGFGLAVGWIAALADAPFKMVYSVPSIITAFLVSTFIGVAFGFLPARSASRLDPVAALSRD